MANPEHLKLLKQGVKAWNQWRKDNPNVIPDLYGADLVNENLHRADLSAVDLRGAELRVADLSEAKLCKANLSEANLGGAFVRRADFDGTNLRGANFNEADLSQVYLNEADLGFADFRHSEVAEANFTNSIMYQTAFADVDLSQAKGLEDVVHSGPSTIGIDTLYRSKGKIPDIFLRGAGVSDQFIAFIRAMGGAIQFYSCFISYSSKDQLFAERLYADLQARGVRCWFAPHDVQGGKKLHEQIDNAIQMHERLLLILSPDSINSEWVKTEIAKARKREVAEKRRMLFPVLLKISYTELKEWECFDADTGKDSAREIRE